VSTHQQIGRLSAELFRSCRLVVDTGLHSKGWSVEQAKAFMAKHTAASEGNIDAEVGCGGVDYISADPRDCTLDSTLLFSFLCFTLSFYKKSTSTAHLKILFLCFQPCICTCLSTLALSILFLPFNCETAIVSACLL